MYDKLCLRMIVSTVAFGVFGMVAYVNSLPLIAGIFGLLAGIAAGIMVLACIAMIMEE